MNHQTHMVFTFTTSTTTYRRHTKYIILVLKRSISSIPYCPEYRVVKVTSDFANLMLSHHDKLISLTPPARTPTYFIPFLTHKVISYKTSILYSTVHYYHQDIFHFLYPASDLAPANITCFILKQCKSSLASSVQKTSSRTKIRCILFGITGCSSIMLWMINVVVIPKSYFVRTQKQSCCQSGI